jgi:hypothetical protein
VLQVDSCLTFGHNINATGDYTKQAQKAPDNKATKQDHK